LPFSNEHLGSNSHLDVSPLYSLDCLRQLSIIVCSPLPPPLLILSQSPIPPLTEVLNRSGYICQRFPCSCPLTLVSLRLGKALNFQILPLFHFSFTPFAISAVQALACFRGFTLERFYMSRFHLPVSFASKLSREFNVPKINQVAFSFLPLVGHRTDPTLTLGISAACPQQTLFFIQ